MDYQERSIITGEGSAMTGEGSAMTEQGSMSGMSLVTFIIFWVIVLFIVFGIAVWYTNTRPVPNNTLMGENSLIMNRAKNFEYPVYVINLDHHTKRWDYVTEQLDRLKIKNYSRWAATYGKDVSDDYLHSIGIRDGLISMSRGMAGCAASHITLWKHIAENDMGWTLILEDDVNFHPEFRRLFPEYWKDVPTSAHVVYLGYYDADFFGYRPSKAVFPKSVVCLNAYMTNAEGARYLLNNVLPLNREIDIAIQHHYLNRPFNTWCFNDDIQILGMRPRDYKDKHPGKCWYGGIVYQNREDIESVLR